MSSRYRYKSEAQSCLAAHLPIIWLQEDLPQSTSTGIPRYWALRDTNRMQRIVCCFEVVTLNQFNSFGTGKYYDAADMYSVATCCGVVHRILAHSRYKPQPRETLAGAHIEQIVATCTSRRDATEICSWGRIRHATERYSRF